MACERDMRECVANYRNFFYRPVRCPDGTFVILIIRARVELSDLQQMADATLVWHAIVRDDDIGKETPACCVLHSLVHRLMQLAQVTCC